jgi:hypothetical protein
MYLNPANNLGGIFYLWPTKGIHLKSLRASAPNMDANSFAPTFMPKRLDWHIFASADERQKPIGLTSTDIPIAKNAAVKR